MSLYTKGLNAGHCSVGRITSTLGFSLGTKKASAFGVLAVSSSSQKKWDLEKTIETFTFRLQIEIIRLTNQNQNQIQISLDKKHPHL